MKQYQVTKKLQVTIPKRLADRAGIVPGDSVVFEETDGEITLRKAGHPRSSAKAMSLAVSEFAADLETIAPKMRAAGRDMNESLSRHVSIE